MESYPTQTTDSGAACQQAPQVIPQHTGPELPFSLLFGRKSNEPALGSQGLWLSGRGSGPKHHERSLRKEHGNCFLILLHGGGLMRDSPVLFISQPHTSRCRIIFWGMTRQGMSPSPGELGSLLYPMDHMLVGLILGHPARTGQQSTTVLTTTYGFL